MMMLCSTKKVVFILVLQNYDTTLLLETSGFVVPVLPELAVDVYLKRKNVLDFDEQ